jgi:hypothetical protein
MRSWRADSLGLCLARSRNYPMLKKDFEGGLRATLIQGERRTSNIDSKIHLLGFDCFNFQFHSFILDTFSTASVRAGPSAMSAQCLDRPPKRTQVGHHSRAGQCQFRTHAVQQTVYLFNHLVGEREQLRGKIDAERLRGL